MTITFEITPAGAYANGHEVRDLELGIGPRTGTLAEVADLLDRAVEHIRTDGWHQGGFIDGKACCAWGAINIEASGDADDVKYGTVGDIAVAFLEAYLRETGAATYVAEWNDAPGQTAEQVIEGMRSCAAAVRACVR